ncbi:MAG: hypothetical protein DRI90_15370, partial [Deltaproteobacteria bacterium]
RRPGRAAKGASRTDFPMSISRNPHRLHDDVQDEGKIDMTDRTNTLTNDANYADLQVTVNGIADLLKEEAAATDDPEVRAVQSRDPSTTPAASV